MNRPYRLSRLETFLRLFANVCAREGLTRIILMLNILLLLMAYYCLWTALSIYLVRKNRRWRAVAPTPASDPV